MSFFYFNCYELYFIIRSSVKQNIGYVWFLRPHTLSKLMLSIIRLSVK